MSYTPTVWQTGDVVTSAKLNKLEGGVAAAGGGGSVLVVNVAVSAVDGTPVYTADKTAGEMYEAAQNGVVVYHTINPLNGLVAIEYLTLYGYLEGTYAFGYSGAGDGLTASSSTDYPTGTGGK